RRQEPVAAAIYWCETRTTTSSMQVLPCQVAEVMKATPAVWSVTVENTIEYGVGVAVTVGASPVYSPDGGPASPTFARTRAVVPESTVVQTRNENSYLAPPMRASGPVVPMVPAPPSPYPKQNAPFRTSGP